MKVKSLSHVRLLVTPWTAAYQAPPSMGFSSTLAWKIPWMEAHQSKMPGILSVNICLKNKKRKKEDLPDELSLEG